MKILKLTLKKKWFDLIASGEKLEEYREIKPYWLARLCTAHPPSVLVGGDYIDPHTGRNYDLRQFDRVEFKNGYHWAAPKMTFAMIGISIGEANPEWSDGEKGDFFRLHLGKKVEE